MDLNWMLTFMVNFLPFLVGDTTSVLSKLRFWLMELSYKWTERRAYLLFPPKRIKFHISILDGVKSQDERISIATSKLNSQITTIMLSASYPTVQFCFVNFYLPLWTLLATDRTAFQCFLPFPLNKLALAPSIWFPFRQQPCTCSHLLSCWIPLNISSSARAILALATFLSFNPSVRSELCLPQASAFFLKKQSPSRSLSNELSAWI